MNCVHFHTLFTSTTLYIKMKSTSSNQFWGILPRGVGPLNIYDPLYNSIFFPFHFYGSWYSKQPAGTHNFIAKIGFEKYAQIP